MSSVRVKRVRLGQHFLADARVVDAIIAAAELNPADTVLEIGPGKGILTAALLGCAGHVIAVEKDGDLATLLREKFLREIENGRLILVHADILSFRPHDYSLLTNYSLVSNIPYALTGEILRKFLGGDAPPSKMILLVQKEVALRIMAKDRKQSVLSVSVAAYGTPHFVKRVKRGSFSPAPRVDSAILAIEDISRRFFIENVVDEKRFFELLKAGFAHKRKYLINNLKEIVPRAADVLSLCHISPRARAENLCLDEWDCLTHGDSQHHQNLSS